MSINDVSPIRELFQGFYFKEVTTCYSLGGGMKKVVKPVGELLIANFDI